MREVNRGREGEGMLLPSCSLAIHSAWELCWNGAPSTTGYTFACGCIELDVLNVEKCSVPDWVIK